MIKLLLDNVITKQDLLNEYNANVTYILLPKRINGFAFDYKNINNIYINNSLSIIKKKQNILRELAHVELCHLDKQYCYLPAFSLKDIEDEADEYISKIKKESEV